MCCLEINASLTKVSNQTRWSVILRPCLNPDWMVFISSLRSRKQVRRLVFIQVFKANKTIKKNQSINQTSGPLHPPSQVATHGKQGVSLMLRRRPHVCCYVLAAGDMIFYKVIRMVWCWAIEVNRAGVLSTRQAKIYGTGNWKLV